MPKINNSTEKIQEYLRAGGKVEKIEEQAQQNLSIYLGETTIYTGNSKNSIVFEVASQSDIQQMFMDSAES